MGFAEQYTLAVTATFVQRVEIAAAKSAIAVQNEAGSTPGHAQRSVFAAKVLHAPDSMAARIAVAVCTNATITAGSTDADIEFTVNSMWNAFSDVQT